MVGRQVIEERRDAGEGQLDPPDVRPGRQRGRDV
jgi:hypothetical protein